MFLTTEVVSGLDPQVMGFDWLTYVLAGVGTLLAIGMGYIGVIVSKFIKNSKVSDSINAALKSGVQHTYDFYVKEIKKGTEEGSAGGRKLTPEERQKAFSMSVEYAKTLLKKEGIELAKVMQEEYLPSKIKEIINMFKWQGSGLSNDTKKN